MKIISIAFNLALMAGLVTFSGCGDDDEPSTPGVTVNAGADQTVTLGETVSLDGTATDAAGGSIIYLWEITVRPAGSVTIIASPLLEDPTFIPDAIGEYTIRLTATNDAGSQASDEVIVTVEQGMAPEEIGGTISTNTTLVNRIASPLLPDYIASSDVLVNAVLTIQPGVRIVFADDEGLSVSPSGSLVAVGTSAEGIVFTGVQSTKGFWKGIELESNAAQNEMTYCTVEFGGSSGFDGANLLSNLMVQQSGKVKITNSDFTNGSGYGLYTRSLESALPDFANNTFTANEAPVMTRINHYHYFDAGSDYTGNADDYIDSYWSNQNTSENVMWNALNVPYRMANNVEQIESDIAIAAGAEFLGQTNGGIEVVAGGSLKAVGTAVNTIDFSGEQNVRGYWKGIVFESNTTDNELTYVNISNGGEEGFDGANLKSNIMVDNSGRVKVTNTTSTMSGGYGLYTRTLEASLPEFADNTFTNNVAPVMTRINHYHYFDGNSSYTGNDDDYIDSYWSNSDVTTNVTWNALNVPYRMANNVEDIDADVTVEAGTNFIGQPNGGIRVTANGSLNADGTASAPITFAGEQDVVGYWKGLRFLSNNASNVLDNVVVSNGGEEGFDGANRKANIEIANGGLLTITNSELSKSGGNGIRVQSGGNLTQSGLTFTGNAAMDILTD
ncbi:hypothetical protein FNH22_00280 [Fulvivirga sp. M361]|uniref:PKD domain-containing protein n=1 Tax=Fulvivirga sp. M361 TaxID=2594266 RepID=UPI00117A8399|nr:PKD domain-containing protein [Fulvivirga sp. M361]TRX62567.1 hypothetical protein FNH22_00280 [Fulvivirga sp. M361]